MIRKQIWPLVLAMVCWSIWLERNNQMFNDYDEPSYKMYKRAKEKVISWARHCKGYDALDSGTLVRDELMPLVGKFF